MTSDSTHVEPDDAETRALDRRVAEALDLYADDSGPPGLAAMAARARRGDTIIKTLSGAASAVLVFAAGWSADDLLSNGTEMAPHAVAELMETERDWDLDPERVTFADLSDGAVSPVALTELGLVLSSTETRRVRSGAIQRMEYVTPEGRTVSVVLRREARQNDSPLNVAAYRGQAVVHWTDGPFSFGVMGEVPREDLFDIAEMVRARLNVEPARPIAPVAGGFPDLAGPAVSSDRAAAPAPTVSTETLPAASTSAPGG